MTSAHTPDVQTLLETILAEQRAARVEQRQMAEVSAGLSRAIARLHENDERLSGMIAALRDDLLTMMRAELGGLFAHLETRLEQRIDSVLREHS